MSRVLRSAIANDSNNEVISLQRVPDHMINLFGQIRTFWHHLLCHTDRASAEHTVRCSL